MTMKLSCSINGVARAIDVPANRRVVDLLREDLGLTGTKEGCGTGECGACTVLVDGRSRLSCLMLAGQLEGRRITTIEGLAEGEQLHPLQSSFVRQGAVQCGFCTPGMVLTATDLLDRQPHPDRSEIARAISGNICRCTGYQKIIDAIAHVDNQIPPVSTAPAMVQPRQQRVEQVHSAQTITDRPVFFPASLDELWRLIAAHPDARLFCGGTDLLVWLRARRVDPPALIGLERLGELHTIAAAGDTVRIGAATSHADLLADPLVTETLPVLAQALQHLGSPHIRRMGTIGGNLVTASPAGDTLPPLTVLDASVELLSADGCRTLSLHDFINGPGRTALLPGEILSSIVVPLPPPKAFHHFEKVGLRSALACSVASLAALIERAQDGTIHQVRLAWGSVGPTVTRLPEIETDLLGKPLTEATFTAVLPAVRLVLSPISDVRAGADYRRQVAANLLLRLPEMLSESASDERPADTAAASRRLA
jgi:xanthine dehydrogenase small subunit